ncbi:hypothetical protein GIB67_036572 [Kingdonia uniflora]|uniref:Uncharacterized protein n=1 Tax=Kingdonia uniflora TaxID=39325 RepID=A0A7J7MEA9_9MAGN|nr:hypothetical protein GIB67_036572 [Kingdonia uniflora]
MEIAVSGASVVAIIGAVVNGILTPDIIGMIDLSRDAWIHREDWICNGIHIGSGRKYRDSFFLQAQPMCYVNSESLIGMHSYH